jgi:hypothetical protein
MILSKIQLEDILQPAHYTPGNFRFKTTDLLMAYIIMRMGDAVMQKHNSHRNVQ